MESNELISEGHQRNKDENQKIIFDLLINNKALKLFSENNDIFIEFEKYGRCDCTEEAALQLATEVGKSLCTRSFSKEFVHELALAVDIGLRSKGNERNYHDFLSLKFRLSGQFSSQNHADKVHQIRIEDGKRNWELHQDVCEYAIEILGQLGKFYHADQQAYWFNLKDHILFSIDSMEFKVELAEIFSINPEDSLMSWVISGLKVHVLKMGKKAVVRMLTYFDRAGGKLYIQNSPNTVYRLDGKKVELIPNGEDGVLFMWRREWASWEAKNEDLSNHLETCILIYLSVDSAYVDPSEAKALVRAWLLYGFFAERTRPILILIGEKGSAKTTVLRLIGIVLLGENFEVTGVERSKQDGLIAYLTNLPYGVIDNADEDIPWLPDTLARTATSQAIPKRKLYTTNDLAMYPTKINLGITSRDPLWARDDVIDRCIPIHTVRPSEFIPEEEIYGPIKTMRDSIWGELLSTLNVALLKYQHKEQLRTWTRISEFEYFARTACNIKSETFQKILGLQYGLAAQREEEILTLLPSWFEAKIQQQITLDEKNNVMEIRTSQLLEELKSYATKEEMTLTIRNPSVLGKKIKDLQSNLRHSGIEVSHREDGRGSIWVFRKNGEK